jgi:hypothetical protein
MVRKPGGCEESLIFIIVSLKRLCQVWQKWTVIGLNETCGRFLKFSESPLILYKITEIPSVQCEKYSVSSCLSVYFANITEPMCMDVDWNWLMKKKSIGLGVLLIPGSVGLVKYAGVEFANAFSQWESKAGCPDQSEARYCWPNMRR